MAQHTTNQTDQARDLYERYGKPLEEQHTGKYLAVSPEGKTLLASTLLEAARQASATFGPDSFIFKVGEHAVGKWRWLVSGL